MKTLREAAQSLGVDAKTLRKWLERAQMAVELDPLDRRLRLVSDDQLAELARQRDRFMAQDDVLARLAELERRLAALEARSVLPAPLPRMALPPRQIASTAAYTPYTPRAGDTLPADWIAFSTWARKHGLRGHERSMPPLIEQGRLPAPQTRAEGWRRHGNAIKSAYSLEQHREASRIAAARWPLHFHACDDCRAEVAPHAPDAVGPDE